MTQTTYANFQGNPLLQATKRHLNDSETVKNKENDMRGEVAYLFVVVVFSACRKIHLSYHFSLFLTASLLFKCRFVARRREFPCKFGYCCLSLYLSHSKLSERLSCEIIPESFLIILYSGQKTIRSVFCPDVGKTLPVTLIIYAKINSMQKTDPE